MTNATQITPIDLQEYLEYTYPNLTDNEIKLHLQTYNYMMIMKNIPTIPKVVNNFPF